MRKNNEKGITLVALIITMIIMLILLSVVINIAVDDSIPNQATHLVGEMQEQDRIMNEVKSEVRDQINLGVMQKNIIVVVSDVTNTTATIATNNKNTTTDTVQYNLYINETSHGSNTTGIWELTGLTSGTTYEYRVVVQIGEYTVEKTGNFKTD